MVIFGITEAFTPAEIDGFVSAAVNVFLRAYCPEPSAGAGPPRVRSRGPQR
jgi:hypothetical protein